MQMVSTKKIINTKGAFTKIYGNIIYYCDLLLLFYKQCFVQQNCLGVYWKYNTSSFKLQ